MNLHPFLSFFKSFQSKILSFELFQRAMIAVRDYMVQFGLARTKSYLIKQCENRSIYIR